MAVRGDIRVVLADDHAMVREALAQILQESGCMRVVGQAADGPGAVDAALKLRPDVLVLDYSMPGLAAPEALSSLRQLLPDLKVLVLTVHENIHYCVKALECGAHGYVVKSAAVGELVDAIKAVSVGEVYISPKVSQKVIQHLRRPKKERVGLESLSQREFELLRLLGAGMSLKECADRLSISTSSASTYRSRLLEKLNLKSTAEVIRFALENDIVG
ncbi:MAG TPA: response regulator transcription factor [Gemmataceae bacterium]|nr:response regulator transcription factor [Gemmataceae bacterium]